MLNLRGAEKPPLLSHRPNESVPHWYYSRPDLLDHQQHTIQ